MSDATGPRGRGRGRGRGGFQQQQPAGSRHDSAAPQQRQQIPQQGESGAFQPRSDSAAGGRGRGTRPRPGPHAAAAGDLNDPMQRMQISGSAGGDQEKPVGRGVARSGLTRDFTEDLIKDMKPATYKGKEGHSGKPVALRANYFKIETDKMFTVYKHHVHMDPFEERTHFRKRIIRDVLKEQRGYLYDGSSIFCYKDLCKGVGKEGLKFEWKFPQRNKSDEEKPITTVRIVNAGTLEYGDYQYIQLFNIVTRGAMGELNLQELRRKYYDPGAAVNIEQHKIILWPGYDTSVIRVDNNQMLLQAEICTKVLRTETALEVMKNCRSTDEMIKVLVGVVVMTTYNNKTYQISDIDFKQNPGATFERSVLVRAENGERKRETQTITLSQYYSERYGLQVRDARQPLLVHKTNAKKRRAGEPELILLIPEFCVMTGLDDNMRNNFTLMKGVAEHTNMNPAGRVQRLTAFNSRIRNEQRSVQKFTDWNMRLSGDLISVPGRELAKENILFHESGKVFTQPDDNMDWTRYMIKKEMLRVVNLTKWTIVYVKNKEADVKNFFNVLQQCARGMNMEIKNPTPYPIAEDRTTAFAQQVEKSINECDPQLVMCIVVNNRQTDRYSCIKKKCIVDKNVASQVITQKTLTNRGLMSIATKVAVQINCKLGGAPWAISLNTKDLMVVGFDVTHDPKDKRRSFSAMVSTYDIGCSKYYSSVTQHNLGEEISINFGLKMAMAVAAFQKHNGVLPGKIIVYRDGVGEGQLAMVKSYEIDAIEKHLKPMYDAANMRLKLSYIVVTKRINTRIFSDFGPNRRPENPKAGTIVDQIITNPLRYDFYLISQDVKNRTVAPTHYIIMENTTGWDADILQRITYKFTHVYYNWSGTIRVPAPCQYAHKLAFLTAQSIGQEHSTRLCDKLYYL